MTKGMDAELEQKIASIASEILYQPDAPELDAQIRELQAKHGEWVAEAITDRLTEDIGYSQHLQDWLNRGCKDAEVVSASANATQLSVCFLEVAAIEASATRDVLGLLTQLLPADVGVIPRESHLSRVERDVWYMWLEGKSFSDMRPWLTKADGTCYAAASIRHIFRRIRHKIDRCSSIGWRTTLAEDIARGPHGRRPNCWTRVSQIRKSQARED